MFTTSNNHFTKAPLLPRTLRILVTGMEFPVIEGCPQPKFHPKRRAFMSICPRQLSNSEIHITTHLQTLTALFRN